MHPRATDLFLGITDSAVEGDWKLFNGNPTTYMGPWSSHGSQPNGGVNENHAIMYTKKGTLHVPQANVGDWQDVGYTNQRASYCIFEPIQFRVQKLQKL